MLDKVEGNLLFDFYGALLTEHQKEVLDDYFNDDLSMSELADEYEVSKSAISDLIKRCLNQLEEYESKLHLIKQARSLDELIDKIIKESDFYEFGARRLDKIISREIENVILEAIINNVKDVYIDKLNEYEKNITNA